MTDTSDDKLGTLSFDLDSSSSELPALAQAKIDVKGTSKVNIKGIKVNIN